MSAGLAGELRAISVRRVAGMPVPGLDAVVVTDPLLALVLADAEARLGRLGAATRADGGVTLSAGPGQWADVAEPEEPGALRAAARSLLPPDPGAVVPLDPAASAAGVAVLAGPWVVRLGGVEGLRALAAATGAPVVNTWGAKGVFAWDDAHHAGTAGLQARDFELAELADVGLLVTTGLDPAEVTSRPWEATGTAVVDVPVHHLAHVTGEWPAPSGGPARPALYRDLAAAVQPLYASDQVPLRGPRAARHLATALPAGGLVAADAGLAGFWVGRCFPTAEPGSVVVPATRVPGLAVAAALLAALDGRAAVAVVEAVDEVSAALLELAGVLGAAMVVEQWGDDGRLNAAGDHAERLAEDLRTPGASVRQVPVALDSLDEVVAVAGDIVAW